MGAHRGRCTPLVWLNRHDRMPSLTRSSLEARLVRSGAAPLRGWRTSMKLMWFHLMPYTELPDDFREKHPSVWVDIHSSLFDPLRAHHMYNDFMDELEFAAECGFDA